MFTDCRTNGLFEYLKFGLALFQRFLYFRLVQVDFIVADLRRGKDILEMR